MTPSLRKERPNRAIDQAARENFLLAGLALALEEAARNPSGGIGVFAVVNGEREEVDSLAWVGRGAGGDEDDGVARSHQDGAVRLLGEAPGLEGDRASAYGDFACVHDDLSEDVNTPGLSTRSTCPALKTGLLADSETADQLPVSIGVLAFEVIQESAALADELQQPAA